MQSIINIDSTSNRLVNMVTVHNSTREMKVRQRAIRYISNYLSRYTWLSMWRGYIHGTAGATRYVGKTFSPRWIVNDIARRGLIRVQLFPSVSFARTADISIMFAISKWLRLPQSPEPRVFPRHRRPAITGFF